MAILFLSGAHIIAQEDIKTDEPVDETTLLLNIDEIDGADNQDVDIQAIGLSDLFKTILVLLLVIAAIYAVLYLLKKFSVSNIDGSSLINVVGSKGISKESAVHLLEVGNQVFLVGSGSSSVNLISEITDKETIDNIRLNLSKDNPAKKGTFLNLVSTYMGSSKKIKNSNRIKETETFLRSQRDKLKDL